MRGIVITPRFEFDGKGLYFPHTGIEAVDLREYLLYWDKIDFPDNNLISIGSSPDVQFLIEAGVLSRTRVRLTGFSGNLAYGYILAQAKTLETKNNEEPGLWSMAQTGSKLFLPPELSHETRSLEIELYKALPVPSDNVSLEDVLLFRERYKDELFALRAAMDQLYLEVIDSSDLPRAKTIALDRLEHSLQDLHKVTNESWTSKFLSSLRVELHAPELVKHALAGAAVGAVFGVSTALSAAIGAATAAIKFELRVTRSMNELPPTLRDFAYLHKIEQELST